MPDDDALLEVARAAWWSTFEDTAINERLAAVVSAVRAALIADWTENGFPIVTSQLKQWEPTVTVSRREREDDDE